MTRTLETGEVRRFYDRLGSRQDWQSFYEDPALDVLIREAGFPGARHVLEFGSGTGRLAERLLCRELPAEASYLGIDVSSTMVALASRRLAPFGPRARVALSEGAVRLPFERGSFDRFVSTYVLDLLAEERILELLAGAHGLLAPAGRLCLASLTRGRAFPCSVISRAWATVHSLRPGLLGGCRPIEIRALLDPALWRTRHREVIAAWGIPSEVLVAEPL